MRRLQPLVAVALAGVATLARAAAPGALELGVATGWTRGFGRAAGEMMPKLQDLAGNGGAVKVRPCLETFR